MNFKIYCFSHSKHSFVIVQGIRLCLKYIMCWMNEFLSCQHIVIFFPQFPFVFSRDVEKPIRSYIKYLFVIMDALS